MLKRWLSLLLVLLLLTGCAVQPTTPTEFTIPPTVHRDPEPTQPTAPPVTLYIPGTTLEQQTGGAITCYETPSGDYGALYPMGERLLLVTTGGATRLAVLEGKELAVTAQTNLGIDLPVYNSIQADETGVGYYDYTQQAVILLDEHLKKTAQVSMPADMVDAPLISPDRKQVYYCTGEGVRVLDLATGIHRPLRQGSYGDSYFTGLFFGGRVLGLSTTNQDGKFVLLYLSTVDGREVGETYEYPTLYTGETYYYSMVSSGSVTQRLYGLPEEPIMCLYPREEDGFTEPLPAAHAYLLWNTTDDGIVMDYYDLESGMCTASIHVPGLTTVYEVCYDRENHRLFFAGEGVESPRFYCWEMGANPTEDDTVYTHTLFTRENPDVAGLEGCARTAYDLSQQYGVDIRIQEAAVADVPEEYRFEQEYQVAAIAQALEDLNEIMAVYPEGFFTQAAEGTLSGTLHISLVRGIYGAGDEYSVESAVGLQYWVGQEAHIALAIGSSLQGDFCHEMSHVIDNRVLVETVAYDDWESLNPRDFTYDYNYADYLDRYDSPYLQEETRAFIDSYSMSFPKEDRARIMEYAMQPGNEFYFTTDVMQEKLRVISAGIRRTFGLKDYTDVLLWEQYLRT